ncbi:MAG: DsrE family protein [Spirochaetales bacterium]|nr:DsrE family protein [Spirochaetales bacterium]
MNPAEHLVVIWSSADPEVAREMAFMYTHNAKLKAWWPEVTLVIWGPSARLLTQEPDLQERLKRMLDAGIRVEACKACADHLGVSDALEALGVDVRYMGLPLTEYLKEGRKVLSF